MRSYAVLMALILSGCLAPPTPAQQVTDAARELNLAARFGRMDIALGKAAPEARDRFMQRRQSWGHELRVVDVELSGMQIEDADNAQVTVDVAWMRMREGILRSTRLAQTYKRDDKGWQLTREHQLAGDRGLFGETVPSLPQRPHKDVHFPTRTLGSVD